MIRCVVIDDEPLAQQVLERHIARTGELTLVAKCFNAIEAFAVLHQQPVDLLFLDIKMPAMSGMTFIQSLSAPPAFIFTTAYEAFAVQSYELNAVDYLLKPVTYERFKKAVDRFLQRQPVVAAAPPKDYLYVKVNGALVRILHKELLFAEAMKDYIKITTTTGSHITHMTLKSFLQLLPDHLFKRIHRSYIVNISCIDVISKEAVTIRNTPIPIGENYKGNLDI